jgi:hypothetical protein
LDGPRLRLVPEALGSDASRAPALSPLGPVASAGDTSRSVLTDLTLLMVSQNASRASSVSGTLASRGPERNLARVSSRPDRDRWALDREKWNSPIPRLPAWRGRPSRQPAPRTDVRALIAPRIRSRTSSVGAWTTTPPRAVRSPRGRDRQGSGPASREAVVPPASKGAVSRSTRASVLHAWSGQVGSADASRSLRKRTSRSCRTTERQTRRMTWMVSVVTNTATVSAPADTKCSRLAASAPMSAPSISGAAAAKKAGEPVDRGAGGVHHSRSQSETGHKIRCGERPDRRMVRHGAYVRRAPTLGGLYDRGSRVR